MDQVNNNSSTGSNQKRRDRQRRRGRGSRSVAEAHDTVQPGHQGQAAVAAGRRLVSLTRKENDTVSCTVCLDDLPQTSLALKCSRKVKGQRPSISSTILFPSCNHPYCSPCLTSWILATLTDCSLAFPTTCASANCPETLSPDLLDKLALPGLTSAHRAAYRDRHVVQVQHFAQPCPNPDCSAIIYASDRTLDQARVQPNSIDAGGAPDLPELRVQCLFCCEFACFRCRIPSHKPMTCSEFASLPEEAKHHPEDFTVLRMGHVLQWKRCPGCATLVDRKDGCNFIKCACGVGFCYRCGERYKSLEPTEAMQHGQPGCRCDLFDIPPDPLAAAGWDVGRLVHGPGLVAQAPVHVAHVGVVEALDRLPAAAAEAPAAADHVIQDLFPILGDGMVIARPPPNPLPAGPAPQREQQPPLPPVTQDDVMAAVRFTLLLRVARTLTLDKLCGIFDDQTYLNVSQDICQDLLDTAVQMAMDQSDGQPMPADGDMHAFNVDAVLRFALRLTSLQEMARFMPKAAKALGLHPLLAQRIKAFVAQQRALIPPAMRPRDRANDVEMYLTRNPWPRTESGLRVMPHGQADAMEDMPFKIIKYARVLFEENTCHQCHCAFATLEDAVTHLFTTTDHEVYLCCNRPFKELRGLVQHIRKVHAEDGLGRLEDIVPRA